MFHQKIDHTPGPEHKLQWLLKHRRKGPKDWKHLHEILKDANEKKWVNFDVRRRMPTKTHNMTTINKQKNETKGLEMTTKTKLPKTGPKLNKTNLTYFDVEGKNMKKPRYPTPKIGMSKNTPKISGRKPPNIDTSRKTTIHNNTILEKAYKYDRMRALNNKASREFRMRKKYKLKQMEIEISNLETKNKSLKEEETKLVKQRDLMKGAYFKIMKEMENK